MKEAFLALKAHRKESRHECHASVLAMQEEIEAWCADHNVTLKVHNSGLHWQFIYHRVRIDWWPSTGKAMRVRNIKWECAPKTKRPKMAYSQTWEDIRATIEGELAMKVIPNPQEAQ